MYGMVKNGPYEILMVNERLTIIIIHFYDIFTIKIYLYRFSKVTLQLRITLTTFKC